MTISSDGVTTLTGEKSETPFTAETQGAGTECHDEERGQVPAAGGLVVVRDLVKDYGGGVKALAGVSMHLAAGEWMAVMGPSGSGKSTLLNILSGLDRPSSGSVEVGGVPIHGMSQSELTRYRRESVGLVFQQFHLIPYLTALENVMLAQYYHSMAERREAAAMLAEVGLGDRQRHLPGQLSGGEQQRVCIARALVNHPKILFADEPTGNLDAANETLVLGLLERLHRADHTILMVTHSVEVGRRADRILQLEHGRAIGSHLLPPEAEENIDELLEWVWILRERNRPYLRELLAREIVPEERAVIDDIVGKGLLTISEGYLNLTAPGEVRARALIRRQRLAELLFMNNFQMDPKIAESSACKFEHTLTPEVTESICAFLGHPPACPHEKPIPRGDCCPRLVSPSPVFQDPLSRP